MKPRLRSIACLAVAASVSACASLPAPVPRDERAAPVQSCRELYAAIDEQVERAGVADGEYARIAGFTYLRIDRFFAADGIKPAAGSATFDAWVEHLRRLDLGARALELQNLPAGYGHAFGESLHGRLEECSRLLMRTDMKSAALREQLLESAWVPDDYSLTKRIFGLYPFTSLPFLAGVKNLHDHMRAVFAEPLAELPVEGRLTRYTPPEDAASVPDAELRARLADAERDPFGIPQLSAPDRERLFETFAPVYEIDVVNDDDRIGGPYWAGDGKPSVDVTRALVFRRISYTRFEGRTLLQLVYSVWFPARPSSGDFDLLSGRLDGITFRVTLGADGRPLVYDAMHNCGCYYLLLPTGRLTRKPPAMGHEEPPLVAQQIEVQPGRLVLRIAHGTHYLERVYFDASPGKGGAYAMRDDDSLRSLPLANGERRSLFAPDGLVVGSERAERWLFWPMGIAEPGAMRQWGHHATAFVGTRHFDDPYLIERYFERAD